MGERTPSPLLTGLRYQARAIQAVMIRDMMLRFGRNNLGFLWIIVEPMLLTGGVLIIFSAMKPGTEKGIHIVSMILTGYMPLTMWRHTTNAGIHLLRRSSSLLYHRNITVFDAYLGRMIIEGIGTTTALVVIYAGLYAADAVPAIEDPGRLFAAWFLLWWYGSAASLIITALTEYNETWEKFIGPFQYLMVPLSGVFFLIDWLPRQMQDVILLNPMTNCVEFFRAGFFGDQITTHYRPLYVVVFCIFLTWIGVNLLAVSRARFHGR